MEIIFIHMDSTFRHTGYNNDSKILQQKQNRRTAPNTIFIVGSVCHIFELFILYSKQIKKCKTPYKKGVFYDIIKDNYIV